MSLTSGSPDNTHPVSVEKSHSRKVLGQPVLLTFSMTAPPTCTTSFLLSGSSNSGFPWLR
jgi:hypothetical protein